MKYEIHGETLPAVVCELEKGEAMITEKGAMAWMSPNMQMETNAGGIGKAFGRLFSGESMFRNTYTAKRRSGDDRVCIQLSRFIRAPGRARAGVYFQKSAFLASEAGVDLSVYFHKKLGSGLFGGEGFIMQKLSGRGIVFAEFDGHIMSMIWKPASRW